MSKAKSISKSISKFISTISCFLLLSLLKAPQACRIAALGLRKLQLGNDNPRQSWKTKQVHTPERKIRTCWTADLFEWFALDGNLPKHLAFHIALTLRVQNDWGTQLEIGQRKRQYCIILQNWWSQTDVYTEFCPVLEALQEKRLKPQFAELLHPLLRWQNGTHFVAHRT